jgi:Flp pilus assembly pilin Flp
MLDQIVAYLNTAWVAVRSREEGATMPEYALIVAVVALFLITGAGLMATDVGTKFVNIGQTILNTN